MSYPIVDSLPEGATYDDKQSSNQPPIVDSLPEGATYDDEVQDLSPEELEKLPDTPQGIYAALPKELLPNVNHDWVLRQYGLKQALKHPVRASSIAEAHDLYNFVRGQKKDDNYTSVQKLLSQQHPYQAALGSAITDIGALAPIEGAVASGLGEFAPAVTELASATGLGRVLTQGGVGATEGALLAKAHDEPVELGAVVGGLTGGTLGALGEGISKVADITGQTLTPSQEALIASGESHNVPIMTSDVVQPLTFVGEQVQKLGRNVPFTGTAKKIAQRQTGRESLLDDLLKKSFPDSDFQNIKGSLSTTQLNRFGSAAEHRRSLIDSISDTPISSGHAIQEIDKHIDAIKNLKSGKEKKTADTLLINKLEDLKQDVSHSDFESLVDLRTDVRDLVKGDSITLSSRQDSAIKKINKAFTKDIYSTVDDNLTSGNARKFKRDDRQLAIFLNDLKAKSGRSTISGLINKDLSDLSPESFNSQILANDSVKRDKIFKTLSTKGRANLKGYVLNHLAEKSLSENKQGVSYISPTKFANQLDKYSAHLSSYFKGTDRRELDGIKRLLKVTSQSELGKGLPATGIQNVPILLAELATGAIGGLGALSSAGASGLGARVYESKPIRNLLLKLDNLPEGSKAINPTISKITTLLRQGAVSAESKQHE